MKPQIIDLKDEAEENQSFRKVLFTGEKSQLVVMSLPAGGSIGTEVHQVDQLIYVTKGEGAALIDGIREGFKKGAVLCVPAGETHDVINTGDEPLKLFTVYAPPQHAPGTEHVTKADAEAAEAAAV
jgi:mannose-6-phosphate isomerase-like protein (cupin superfamily)